MKFKIGDKVRVVQDYNPGCAATKGSVWVIDRAIPKSDVDGLYFPKHGCGAYSNNLELVIKNIMDLKYEK